MNETDVWLETFRIKMDEMIILITIYFNHK